MPKSGSSSLFWENTNYNTSLAKRHAKPQINNIGGPPVTTEEVLANLAARGIPIKERTLKRYQKACLIPSPQIISRGKAGGRFADYPPETVLHAAVAYEMINIDGHPLPSVANARQEAWPNVSGNPTAIIWKVLFLAQKLNIDCKSVFIWPGTNKFDTSHLKFEQFFKNGTEENTRYEAFVDSCTGDQGDAFRVRFLVYNTDTKELVVAHQEIL